MPVDCKKRKYHAGRDKDRASREVDYVYARTRALLPGRGRRLERGYDVASHFAKVIAARNRKKADRPLEESFREQVDRWKNETGHMSSITRAITHPSYLRIIGMGKEALPLLLKELRERPDHWLVALNAITGEDPAADRDNFREAVAKWISWGEARSLC
jgi:hypothetical protein